MKISYSRAKTFDECQAKFEAEYENPRPKQAPESYLIIGTLIHEVCDQYVQHLLAKKLSSDFSTLGEIAAHVWDSPERQGLSEYFKTEYMELVERVKDSLIFEDIGTVLKSEMKIAVNRAWEPCDYEAPEAFVRGRIDRIDLDEDGSITVVDYKSGHRIEALKDTMQLPLYARMAFAHFPKAQAIDVELNYLRFNIVKHGRVTVEDMDLGKDWIEAVALGIERARAQNHWPARPGAACRGCPIYLTCSARVSASKVVPPNDEADAHRLVERLIFIEREREEINSAMKIWVDQFGGVEVNGMFMGLFPVRKLKYDVPRVAEILEARGFRPLDYMNVSTTALKKIARKDATLAQAIQQVSTDASTTQLKLKRVGEDE